MSWLLGTTRIVAPALGMVLPYLAVMEDLPKDVAMGLNGDDEYFEEDLLRTLEESRRSGRI